MNIFCLLESYRNEKIAMLKLLLSNVAKSILDMTESIPEEILLENFRNNLNRRYIDFWAKSEEERQVMHIQFSDMTEIGEFTLDTTAIDKLNEFLAENYPGVCLKGTFSCDLYEKCIEFPFYFYGGELKTEDFTFFGSSHTLALKPESWKKVKADGFYIFNDDISMWLERDFDKYSWEDCCFYERSREGVMYTSEIVEEAITHISIPLNTLL